MSESSADVVHCWQPRVYSLHVIVTLQYPTCFTESQLLAAQSGNSLVAAFSKIHLLFV